MGEGLSSMTSRREGGRGQITGLETLWRDVDLIPRVVGSHGTV